MGTEPNPDDAPMELNNLDYESQLALQIFGILPDKIEGMNGIWLGKEWAGLFDIMEIYEVTYKKDMLNLILVCQKVYGEYYKEERERNTRLNESKRGR